MPVNVEFVHTQLRLRRTAAQLEMASVLFASIRNNPTDNLVRRILRILDLSRPPTFRVSVQILR